MSPYITTKNRHASERSRNVQITHARIVMIANATLLALAFGAAVLYLVMLNMLVARGYAITILESRQTALQQEQGRLEATLARLRTPTFLREKTATLGLVEVEQPSYQKPETAIALHVVSPNR